MILIADDDPVYVQGLREILIRRAGYEDVRDVATGERVISFVRDQPAPDVLILDMMLPWNDTDLIGARPPAEDQDLRGFQVITELCKTSFDVSRIVVITAYYVPEIANWLREKGLTHILFKPAPIWEIIRAVRGIYPSESRRK
ncbi:response regulator [Candidatus Sumerlaeota bacterium]|nr:response regulator [Candidatus Sumerlaeota bacterium]